MNPHDGDIISGGVSRIRLFPQTHATTSPRRVQKKLDVIYDTGSNLLGGSDAGHKRASSMLHPYDPNARPIAQDMGNRP